MSTAAGVSLTKPYSGPDLVISLLITRSSGPELGMTEQPVEVKRTAANAASSITPRFTPTSPSKFSGKMVLKRQLSQRDHAQLLEESAALLRRSYRSKCGEKIQLISRHELPENGSTCWLIRVA